MFNIEGNSITITAGDTGTISLDVEDYNFVEGDIVTMTVKSNINETSYVFQKVVTDFEDNKAKIFLLPTDTNSLSGKYIYDIQVNLTDGRVQTIITPNTFKVVKGVTS